MPETVKPRRRYDSSRRAEQAAVTRRGVLAAARSLFSEQGYSQTTVGQIAERAGVAVDTIYTSVGRKPAVLRELVETAISGADHAVPAAEREYVQRIQAAGSAPEMLDIYADAITDIQQRMAPIFRALRDAAVSDRDCAALGTEISERRARNMHQFAAGLRATGELRDDLDDGTVADIIWSMNASEYWDLLVTRRGWRPEQFRDFLADAWKRLLLAPPSPRRGRS